MRRIEETDNRATAISKFDSCMDTFFSTSKRFVEEIKRIGNSDENKIKVSTLAINYFHDTSLVSEIVLAYYPYIAHSMLDIRYDKHNDYYQRVQSELIELKMFLLNVINAGGVGMHNMPNKTSAIIHVDPKLLVLDKTIATQLDDEGYLYFEGIVANLQTIETKINELCLINQSRNDDDYEQIYDLSRERYFNSDLWEDAKNGYITYLIDYLYKDGVTISQIEEEIRQCHRVLMEDREIGVLWLARHDKKTQLSKTLVNKNYETSDSLDFLFSTLGKIELLENWKNELSFEMLPCEIAEEKKDICRSVKFIGQWDVERFRKAWPEIYQYINKEKDATYDWCCLHHTLTFYHIIERTTFAIFMRWLHDFAGEILISEVNIRQVSSYYFVERVETQWSLMDMQKYIEHGSKQKLTPQLEKKFHKYSLICQRLRDIIIEH